MIGHYLLTLTRVTYVLLLCAALLASCDQQDGDAGWVDKTWANKACAELMRRATTHADSIAVYVMKPYWNYNPCAHWLP